MKPFQAQCQTVSRKSYESTRTIRGKQVKRMIPPILCEKVIWFEPSLQDGIFVGRCPVEAHNPVYCNAPPY